jgi:hypothetical protein
MLNNYKKDEIENIAKEISTKTNIFIYMLSNIQNDVGLNDVQKYIDDIEVLLQEIENIAEVSR